MQRRVYKYVVEHVSPTFVEGPGLGKIVMFAKQGDELCVWAEVVLGQRPQAAELYIFGTGHDIKDDRLEHVASCQDGLFVWHLYQRRFV